MFKSLEKDLGKNYRDYMTIYEITVEKFNKNSNNRYFINKLRRSITELPTECDITKIDLEEKFLDSKYGNTAKELYLKEDVDRFFANYISKNSLVRELRESVSHHTVYKYYKKLNPKEIILGGNLDIFISKEISQELTEMIKTVAGKGQWGWRTHMFEQYKNRHGYLSFEEVMKKLNCTYSTIQRLIKENLLLISDQYGDRMLFNQDQVQDLHAEQERLIDKYNKNYYTAKQIQAKYSDSFAQYIKGSEDKVRIKVTKVDPPLLLISYFGVQMKLYEKN